MYGRGFEAIPVCDEAISRARAAGATAVEAEALAFRTILHGWTTALDEGVRTGTRALELARHDKDSRAWRLASVAIGIVYNWRGDARLALEHLTEGVTRAEAANDPETEGLGRSSLARMYSWLGEFELGREEARRTCAIGVTTGMPSFEYLGHWAAGMVEFEAGAFDAAVTNLGEARRIADSEHDAPGAAMMELNEADAAVQAGRLDEANAHLDHVGRTIAVGLTPVEWQPFVDEVRGRLEAALGHHDAAAGIFDRSVRASTFEWLTLRALLGRSRALRKAGRLEDALVSYRSAVAAIEQAGGTLTADVQRAGYMATHAAAFREQVALLWDMKGPAGANEAFGVAEAGRARALHDAVRASRVEYTWADRLPTVAELQAALEPHERFLEYVQADERLFLFIISPSGFSWHETTAGGADGELTSRVRFLRSAIVEVDDRSALVDTGLALGRDILGPVLQGGNGTATTLIISPDGILHHVPFGALSMTGPDGQSHFLAERFAISYAPSASVWLDSRKRRTPSAPWLVVSASTADTPLPYADVEGRRVAALMRRGGTRLSGDDATEAALKRARPSDFRILHFATHALMNEAVPLQSHLVLRGGDGEDGRLDASEIYAMRLQAELVVLAACQTGLGRTLVGEGVLSLARAFLYAGARSVVATLWKIDDRRSVEVVTHFYQELMSERSPAQALQVATRTAISLGLPPRVWAAFIIIGTSRPDARQAPPEDTRPGIVLLAVALALVVMISPALVRGSFRA